MADRPEPARPRQPDPAPVRLDLLQVPVSEPRPGVLVLAPAGEVDLVTAPLLRDIGLDALHADPARVVVDLSGLTFCGSTGLVVLIELQGHADDTGLPFCTAGARRLVLRVLEITGLAPVLRHHATLGAVLAESAGV
jgi:anti-anti-sigma factor